MNAIRKKIDLDNQMWSCALAQNHNLILLGGTNKIWAFDLTTSECLWSINVGGNARSMNVDPTSSMLLVGMSQVEILIIDLLTKSVVKKIRKFRGWVNCIEYSKKHQKILAAGDLGGVVCITSGKKPIAKKVKKMNCWASKISSDQNLVYVGGEETYMLVVNMENSSISKTIDFEKFHSSLLDKTLIGLYAISFEEEQGRAILGWNRYVTVFDEGFTSLLLSIDIIGDFVNYIVNFPKQDFFIYGTTQKSTCVCSTDALYNYSLENDDESKSRAAVISNDGKLHTVGWSSSYRIFTINTAVMNSSKFPSTLLFRNTNRRNFIISNNRQRKSFTFSI